MRALPVLVRRILQVTVLVPLVMALETGCSPPTLQSLNPPVAIPPAHDTAKPHSPQSQTPRLLGKAAALEPPRLGAAVFTPTSDKEKGLRAYSTEWTEKCVGFLKKQGFLPSALPHDGVLAGSAAKALAQHASKLKVTEVDLVVLGAVSPSTKNTQARAFLFYPHEGGRELGAWGFEGRPADAVLEEALGAITPAVQEFWFRRERGRLATVPVEVGGLRNQRDVEPLLQALLARREVVRLLHVATRVATEGDGKAVRCTLYTTEALPDLAGVAWKTPKGQAKLAPIAQGRYRAKYE